MMRLDVSTGGAEALKCLSDSLLLTFRRGARGCVCEKRRLSLVHFVSNVRTARRQKSCFGHFCFLLVARVVFGVLGFALRRK